MDNLSKIEVYIRPNDVWDYFMENADFLRKKSVVIAENGLTGYEICLTSEHNHPTIEVCMNNVVREKYQAINASDILDETTRLFADYLIVPKRKETRKETEEELQHRLIRERDSELMDAFRAFLEVVWDDNPDLFYDGIEEEEILEIMDETLDLIGYDHGYSIRRPCYLVDDDNQEYFSMYPYDVDDDNQEYFSMHPYDMV